MKVFIYSTHTLWPHHAETELEIMQNHLNNGDDIYRFVCNRYFDTCDPNIEHRLHACLRCMDKQVIGEKLLVGSKTISKFPVYEPRHFKIAQKYKFDYSDIDIFKEVKIEDFDIGYAVSSSVISALRDPNPGISENESLFCKFFYSSLAVYFATLDHINRHKPDLIYAFNGRVAHSKPILRAAQKNNIECRIHERGCDVFHYGITVNTTPHDIDNFFNNMQRKWDEGDPMKREEIGANFFEERIRGKEQAWVSFVKQQQKDLLPENWDTSKHNIAIFNTSEDEYESIGPEWKNFLYSTQAEGIEKIIRSFQNNPKYHFYLRIHPNLKGLYNKQLKDAYELKKFKNLTIIDADNPVSTYTLMLRCEKTITFGSSTGIEATYWGKPSILLGKSFYYNLDVAFKPTTHSEVISLIEKELAPKNKSGTLKYGYYFKTFGLPFKYYKPSGFLNGTFKDKDLDKESTFRTKFYEFLYHMPAVKYLYDLRKRFR